MATGRTSDTTPRQRQRRGRSSRLERVSWYGFAGGHQRREYPVHNKTWHNRESEQLPRDTNYGKKNQEHMASINSGWAHRYFVTTSGNTDTAAEALPITLNREEKEEITRHRIQQSRGVMEGEAKKSTG